MLVLCCLAACHDNPQTDDEGNTYAITASFAVDSTVVLDHMVLYTDTHVALHEDSLFLTPDHNFSLEQKALAINEHYLCTDGGELCRFYATEGMEVNVTISGKADSLTYTFAAEHDSINPWLQDQQRLLQQCNAATRNTMVDSLCHLMPSDVRCGLLLRDALETLNDSVFVRRCLGALNQEAKPDWLIKSIDDLLLYNADYKTRSRRLTAGKFVVNDTTTFDMSQSRSEYLLIYCWADYDTTSIDSLKALDKMLDDDYYMKRLTLLTCCLHAADSASWQKELKDIEGTHVWLPAGLADPRVSNWNAERVPLLILCDMYNNQQQRDVWGKELRNALDRLPNRSGFLHTPKTKPHHGR